MSGVVEQSAATCAGRPVQRVNGLSREIFLRDFIAQSKPVIVANGVSHWPALKKWSLESLRHRLAERDVVVASVARGVFSYDLETPRARYETLKFPKAADLVAQCPRDTQYYIMQISLEESLPELCLDVSRLELLSGEFCSPHFWLGGAGLVTPLHWDNMHNLYGQVRGLKRFTLFPPCDFDKLYPYPAGALFSHMSYADPDAAAAWPGLRDADRVECVLEPGDLLFLPAFWWHHVRSLELSMSVNFWWTPNLRECFVPSFLRTLRTAYAQDGLAGLGAPVSTFPGGKIGAARSALRANHAPFAVLFAASALQDAIRTLRHAEHDASLDRPRFDSWTQIVRRVVENETMCHADAATLVSEIGDFLADLP